MGRHARGAHTPVHRAPQRLLCRRPKPPGCRSITTDTCVPICRLADCAAGVDADEVNASGIPYFLVGHVGDGNFHFGYLIDPDERRRARPRRRR